MFPDVFDELFTGHGLSAEGLTKIVPVEPLLLLAELPELDGREDPVECELLCVLLLLREEELWLKLPECEPCEEECEE